MKNRKLITLLFGIVNALFLAGYVEASFIKMNEETGVLTYYKHDGIKIEKVIFEPKIMRSDYKPAGVSYPEQYLYKNLLEKLGLEKVDEIKQNQIVEFFANVMNEFKVSPNDLIKSTDDGSIQYDRAPLVAQSEGDEQNPYQNFDASYNHSESKFVSPKHSPESLRCTFFVVQQDRSKSRSLESVTSMPVTPIDLTSIDLDKINSARRQVNKSPWFMPIHTPQHLYQIGNISQLLSRESQGGASGRQSMLSIQNQNDNQDDIHDID